MSNKKSLGQNDVSRFLLGLGIGLVVGIIFLKPPSGDYSRGFRENATTPRSGSHRAPATSKATK
jgi:hypothetical protein